MIKTIISLLLLALNTVIGGKLRLKVLNNTEWNDVSYKNWAYKETNISVNASSFTISGFSSGGF